MRQFRAIFNDWLTRAAGLIFAVILALTIFNTYSELPYQYPLLGMFSFMMVPVLFILGGVIFVLAILKSQKTDGI